MANNPQTSSLMNPYLVKKKLLEEHGDDYIKGYRADPENKYGGGNGLETQPTLYNKEDMASVLRAMAYMNKHYGTKYPDPQQLAAFALKEGRSDFGINGFAKLRAIPAGGTPDEQDFMPSSANLLKSINKNKNFKYTNTDSPESLGNEFQYKGKDGKFYDFAAAIKAHELMMKAERSDKPVETLWNPGERHYTYGYNNNSNVTGHAQNDALTDHIYNGLGLPKPKLQELSAIPTPDIPDMPIDMPDNYRTGGRVRIL
jgi:hypothetical protein